MKKKSFKNLYSEKYIINKFFKKLSFNKLGTFNLENDAAYLNISKKYKTIVTTDTIVENVDFFSNDPPESIAQKILCVNLSDLSSMGSFPKAYTLSISINSKVNLTWLNKFTKKLYYLQKKYNIYLLGGDISKSKEISLTATFFGQAQLKYILAQKKNKLGDDIWVTGNLGNSFLGYKLLINSSLRINKKQFETFKKKYLYPIPCMFGFKVASNINSATDISDGLYNDLNKLLDSKYGAKLFKNKIPYSAKLKNVFFNNKFKLNIDDTLFWGDDYELIFTSIKKNRNTIMSLGKKNNIKLSLVGTIIKKKGIFDDSMTLIKKLPSFDHFR